MGSYLSVSHNGEPATGEEPKQFRFMGLPPETRKQVYVHLLCPEPDIRRDGEGDSLEIAGLHETAILYVNRQVHEEARDVLLRANEFVRVLTSGLKVTPVLPKVSVRVVAHSPHSHFSKRDAVVRNFRGAVMSYVLQDKTEESGIRERDIPSVYPCDMLIRARDVDEFVRGVADPSIRGVDRLLTGTTHRITIHDPFRPQPEDSNYTNIATQKRLLQPFQKHYQGFADVNIQGEVDTALASSSMGGLKEEGNALFRAGDYFGARKRWAGATSKMWCIRMSRIWPRVKTELGDNLVDALAELSFTIQSNQMQGALAEMRGRVPEDADDAAEYNSMLEWIASSSNAAHSASNTFESAWQPCARQQATMLFRTAQAARLACQFNVAQSLIDMAMDLLPGDPLIQEEAEEIARNTSLLYMMGFRG